MTSNVIKKKLEHVILITNRFWGEVAQVKVQQMVSRLWSWVQVTNRSKTMSVRYDVECHKSLELIFIFLFQLILKWNSTIHSPTHLTLFGWNGQLSIYYVDVVVNWWQQRWRWKQYWRWRGSKSFTIRIS